MQLNSAKDLDVYKKAYDLAMSIFWLSKQFPDEERFALTSQIRRSSRSVCLNLREAWAKRRYVSHQQSGLCQQRNQLKAAFRRRKRRSPSQKVSMRLELGEPQRILLRTYLEVSQDLQLLAEVAA